MSNFKVFEPKLVASENLTVKRILITPEIASEMLMHNTRNRNIRRPVVEHDAEIMERGDWKENGDTIRFDINGTLLDGQHRLLAIIESNTKQYCLVVEGLDPEVFSTIDVGPSKTGGDFFKIEGESNGTLLNAALRNLWTFQTYGNFSSQRVRPTFEQLNQLLQLEPGIRDSIKESERMYKTIRGVTPSTLAALHYICSNINQEQANIFFEKLSSGIGFNDTSDPIYVLYRKFNDPDFLANRTSAGNNYRAAFLIKAWNAFRKNRKIKALTFHTTGPNKEKYPVPM